MNRIPAYPCYVGGYKASEFVQPNTFCHELFCIFTNSVKRAMAEIYSSLNGNAVSYCRYISIVW